MNSETFLKLFPNCVIVKGATQSLLCDLQNGVSHFVPNNLGEISAYFHSHSVLELKGLYNETSGALIDEYVSFLIRNQFAFFCTKAELQLFPDLSMEWDYPAHITNAIIDLDETSQVDFSDLFYQLEGLGCRDVQIRIYNHRSLSNVQAILDCSEFRTIKSIQLYIKNDPEVSSNTYVEFAYKTPRITGLYIHSSEKYELLDPTQAPALIIARVKDRIDSHNHCGVVDKVYFATTMGLFTESIHHNTCLNRKIGIDTEGNIKNCPSMGASFGNVSTTSLATAILHPDFKKYWNITKDQITVCKDCEFRHICTDCRAYLEDPDDIQSKPLKCGYDPYSGTWSEWSTNPLKNNALRYYAI